MPIECCFDVVEMSKSHFHEIDYQVMRHVFDMQNEFGRLCNESIYQSELVHPCSNDGLSVLAEGKIIVSYESFRKSYFLDGLVGRGAIYELKAVEALNGKHESQLLNYLFLAKLRDGKLVNFSSPSVEHRFVSTNVDIESRFSFSIGDSDWDVGQISSLRIQEIVNELLTDWGAFLDVNLCREALFHFFGGEEQMLCPVEISIGGRTVGFQKMHLLDGESGLHVSATIRNKGMYRKQLMKILHRTNLERIQWVDFCRNEIQLITLKK